MSAEVLKVRINGEPARLDDVLAGLQRRVPAEQHLRLAALLDQFAGAISAVSELADLLGGPVSLSAEAGGPVTVSPLVPGVPRSVS